MSLTVLNFQIYEVERCYKHNLFSSFFCFCQGELLKMRQQAVETKHFIEKQEEEERKLLKIISEADAERLRQKKELDQVGYNNNILKMFNVT